MHSPCRDASIPTATWIIASIHGPPPACTTLWVIAPLTRYAQLRYWGLWWSRCRIAIERRWGLGFVAVAEPAMGEKGAEPTPSEAGASTGASLLGASRGFKDCQY